MDPQTESKVWGILAAEMGVPEDCTDVDLIDPPARDLFPDEIEVLLRRIAMCDPTPEGKKHILADDLLVRLLRQLSYDGICNAYETVGKRFS